MLALAALTLMIGQKLLRMYTRFLSDQDMKYQIEEISQEKKPESNQRQ